MFAGFAQFYSSYISFILKKKKQSKNDFNFRSWIIMVLNNLKEISANVWGM